MLGKHKDISKAPQEDLDTSSWWWASCGEAIGVELTQTRRRAADLAVEIQLLNCYAVVEEQRAVLANDRSDWDSLSAMKE